MCTILRYNMQHVLHNLASVIHSCSYVHVTGVGGHAIGVEVQLFCMDVLINSMATFLRLVTIGQIPDRRGDINLLNTGELKKGTCSVRQPM